VGYSNAQDWIKYLMRT